MNNLIVKKLLTSSLYIALALVLECFMFSILGWGMFPPYFMYDVAIILFFAFCIFGAKSQKKSNIILVVLVSVQIIVVYINICVNLTLGDVFSINMLFLVAETTQVIILEMLPWLPLLFLGLIITTMVLALMFLRRIPTEKKEEQKFSKMFFKIVMLIGVTISLSLYSIQSVVLKSSKDDKLYLLGDDYLFNTFSSSKLALQKFGTFAFYVEDIARLVMKPASLKNTTKYDIEKYLSTREYDPKNSSLWNASAKDGDDNLIVLMLESFEWYAISEELTPLMYALANGYNLGTDLDSALYDMYEFYYEEDDLEQEVLKVRRKDYEKAIVNGKVVFEKDDEVSIYDASKEAAFGLTLLNYYSKAKTDYSEASAILGNYPYNQSFTVRGGIAGFSGTKLYSNVDYFFTLPNVLADSGYLSRKNTTYFHTYKSKFYGRDKLLKQFGFGNTMFYEDFVKNDLIDTGDKLSHAILDSQVMSVFLNDFLHLDKNGDPKNSGPFLSFLTTVTTHGEYTTINPLLKEHYEFVDSIDYLGKNTDRAVSHPESLEGQVRTYLAGCLDTEYMLALLINGLIENGMLENTSILCFADHQSYYSGLDINYKAFYYSGLEEYEEYNGLREGWHSLLSETGSYSRFSSERYAVPCFLWSMALDEDATGSVLLDELTYEKYQYVEKFVCAFDILPSLLTMCGIDFNPNYYLGYPFICTDFEVGEEEVELGTLAIISHTGGYFNNRIFSEDGLTVKYAVEGVTVQEKMQFSYGIIKQLEKWYLITALYKYNAFEKVPQRSIP